MPRADETDSGASHQMRKTYVQDETGKFVEKPKRKSRLHFVRGDSDSFVSPVNGDIVTGNRQLREHEKRTGMTNDLDSLREQAANSGKTAAPTTRQRRDMRDTIADSMERASSSGFHREVRYDE